MKKTTFLIACVMALLVGVSTVYAAPLQVKESDSNKSQVSTRSVPKWTVEVFYIPITKNLSSVRFIHFFT